MKTFAPKSTTENKLTKPERLRLPLQDGLSGEAAVLRISTFADNRPESIMQRKLQAIAQMSPRVQHLAGLEAIDNNSSRQLPQRRQVLRWLDRPVQRQRGLEQEEIQMHAGSAERGSMVVQRELDEKWNPKKMAPEFEKSLEEDLRNVLKLYFGLSPEDKTSKYGFSLLHAAKQSAKGDLLKAIDAEIEDLKEQTFIEGIPDATRGKPLDKGAIQQTYLVTVGGKKKVWKPEPSEVKEAFSAFEIGGISSRGPRFSLRGEASSKIAEALGAKVLASTELSFGYDEKGNLVTGQLMDFVEGEPLGKTGTVSAEKQAAIKAEPENVRDLFTLQLIDYITGQVDRHAADVFIGKAGVKAVDHDFSLGKAVGGRFKRLEMTEKEYYEQMRKMAKIMPDIQHVKYLPQFIDRSISETLRAYNVESLDELLGKHLTKAELAALKVRIVHAQEQLDRYMRIVPNWEEHFKEIEQSEAPKKEKKKEKGRKLLSILPRRKGSSKKQEQGSAPPPLPAKEFSGSVPYIQPKFNLDAHYRGQSYRAQNSVQMVQKNLKLNRTTPWLSHGDEEPMEVGGDGVITATSGSGPIGAHTRIFLEKVDEVDSPSTIHTDLQNPDGIRVTIEEIQDNPEMIDKLKNLPRKQSWRVGQDRLDNAKAKAEEIKEDVAKSKYKYAKFGRAPGKERAAINCARYGEKILKAAGISASAGRVFKIPRVLTRPLKEK